MFRLQMWHPVFFAVIMICSVSTFAQIYFKKGEQRCRARTAQERVLLDAVNKNDGRLVEKLLQKGADPNAVDDCGIPIITYAAARGRSDLLRLLITSRVDVNAIDKFKNQPPLLWVIDSLNKYNEEDIYETLKLLVGAGADVNLKGQSDKSALILAVLEEKERLVEILISAGADVNFKDNEKRTAYSYAAQQGNKKLKQILIDAGTDPTIGVKEYKERYGENAFFQASADGRTDVVEAMLAGGMDVNMVNAGKMTALMRAFEDSTVDLLLSAGADVNLRDNAGFTALIWAAAFRRISHVKKLIAAGADVNVQTAEGKTALDFAADPQIRAVLIEFGARVK
jgi:uncharacterized protein